MSISQPAKHSKCDSWMSNNRLWLRNIIKQQRQARYMYLQMDPLDNPLSTRPIQMGRDYSIDPYPNGQFGLIAKPDRQFGTGSVPTRTQTWSDGPQPSITPLRMPKPTSVNKDRHWSIEARRQSTTNWSLMSLKEEHTSPAGMMVSEKKYLVPTSQKLTGNQSTQTCIAKSTKKPIEKFTAKSTKSTKILLNIPIKSNYDVNRIVTEVDFQSWPCIHAVSGTQCYLPMTTTWEISHKTLYKGSR